MPQARAVPPVAMAKETVQERPSSGSFPPTMEGNVVCLAPFLMSSVSGCAETEEDGA